MYEPYFDNIKTIRKPNPMDTPDVSEVNMSSSKSNFMPSVEISI